MFRLTCEKRLMMILVSNRYDVLPCSSSSCCCFVSQFAHHRAAAADTDGAEAGSPASYGHADSKRSKRIPVGTLAPSSLDHCIQYDAANAMLQATEMACNQYLVLYIPVQYLYKYRYNKRYVQILLSNLCIKRNK